MSPTVEELVSACFDEIQMSQRFVPYIRQAEEAGYPQLAKLFRAVVAGETAREALMRKGVVNHARGEDGFYVCPQCGLIFHAERPEQCPVDETPGESFMAYE
jgi:rubrerythrin